MKIQKVFGCLLFFYAVSFRIFEASDISKLLALASGVGCYTLHDFVASKCKKKPAVLSDSFDQKEKKEKTVYEKIYEEFFRDESLVSILSSLYQEGPLSYYLSRKTGKSFSQQDFIAENVSIFTDALIASSYTHDFVKQIKENKFILSKDNNQNIINFSLGVTRGLIYFLFEEQIQCFLSSLSYFKDKKMLTTLLSTILKIVMIPNLDELFYPNIKIHLSNTNFLLSAQKENIELVKLGTLQAKALIYVSKLVDKLRR